MFPLRCHLRSYLESDGPSLSGSLSLSLSSLSLLSLSLSLSVHLVRLSCFIICFTRAPRAPASVCATTSGARAQCSTERGQQCPQAWTDQQMRTSRQGPLARTATRGLVSCLATSRQAK